MILWSSKMEKVVTRVKVNVNNLKKVTEMILLIRMKKREVINWV